MTDTYKTIRNASEGIYKEKGSKFLSFAFPVGNLDDINRIIRDFKKQYYDARHVCFAYMLGEDRQEWRFSDDGEPSGTAGKPVLGQIKSFGLTNVLVIVVRYFGGILLGTGGLITAYREAAASALNNAIIIEKTMNTSVSFQFDYLQLNEVMKVMKEMNPVIIQQKFDNFCLIQLEIRKAEAEKLISKLEKIDGLVFE